MDQDKQPAETTVSLAKISAAKIEANRRNALKSTGPRTPRGKANVRYNAVKHGLLAKQVVMSSKLIGEDPKDFEDVMRGLVEYFQPVGKAEELLVEEIAVSFWRERRALRAEMGEIEKARADHAGSLARSIQADFDLEILTTAQQELSEKRGLSLETISSLSRWFNWELLQGLDGESMHVGRAEELGKRRAALAEMIRAKIATFEDDLQKEDEEEQLKAAERFSIPDTEGLLRILRYQALNDRRLNRAFTQLERLQRQRQGEFVPAPVKVSVEGVQ